MLACGAAVAGVARRCAASLKLLWWVYTCHSEAKAEVEAEASGLAHFINFAGQTD